MLLGKEKKYQPSLPIPLQDRKWPNQAIAKPPTWCSVDLRDGNQALIWPMNIQEKLELFLLLVKIGFKQIEVGFPSASSVEHDFVRLLIEKEYIPDDVTIQVLTQAREHLIQKTFESLQGASKAIVHIYNSTSPLQRKIVFQKDKAEIKKIALDGVSFIKELSKNHNTNITLEYSPESFTATEINYAVDICDSVIDLWNPTLQDKVIINLPATVELSTPNVYADQIELFMKSMQNREKSIISLHTHNDRGTAIAATELGLMAGAGRVEGTLFGNGERTGNVDVVTLALNMLTQGIYPNLDFSNINKVKEIYEKTTKMKLHERHPYVGSLVYTAFSGSHQDAIKKGMHSMQNENKKYWKVPYLPIDPKDVGRTYEAIIRINSQSGKGGVSYILESHFGYNLPKTMHLEFSTIIQNAAEKTQKEISPKEIWNIFEQEYLATHYPFEFISAETNTSSKIGFQTKCTLTVKYNNAIKELQGIGNGPIDSCKNALISNKIADFSLLNYQEHSLAKGSDSSAIAYIQLKNNTQNTISYGVGIDDNINIASIKALISSLNRIHKLQQDNNKKISKQSKSSSKAYAI